MAAPVLVGERVRLRPWADADLAPFAELNADPEVMRHLIAPLSREESDAQSHRIRERMAAQGHGLWALDAPDAQLVSFTSLANTRSQAVMQRTGFTRRGEFDHPRVAPDHAACRQVLFALDAPPGAA